MKSQKNWDIAQNYSSRIMIAGGAIMSLVSCLLSFLPMNRTMQWLIAILFLILFCIVLVILVEKELKK